MKHRCTRRMPKLSTLELLSNIREMLCLHGPFEGAQLHCDLHSLIEGVVIHLGQINGCHVGRGAQITRPHTSHFLGIG